MYKTIMLTGATGYIGSWVAKQLLEKGYDVRITVRDKSKNQAYAKLLELAESLPGKLTVYEADLLKPGSFDAAAKGADALMHVASPFQLKVKDPQKQLIDPALEGTRNVLMAANKSNTVRKVILTSSVAAIYGDAIDMANQGLQSFTEAHFNNTSSLKHQPYSYSKLLAEKEAWAISEKQNQWKLVVINPSFVIGPPLGNHPHSESLGIMNQLLSGKLAMGAPDLNFGFVDVRDVAKAHILALENEKATGRHILAERAAGLIDIAGMVKDEFGSKYRLPTKKAPKWLFYLTGWMFGITTKFVDRNIGHPIHFDSSKSQTQLGLQYIPLEKTVVDMVKKMEGLE